MWDEFSGDDAQERWHLSENRVFPPLLTKKGGHSIVRNVPLWPDTGVLEVPGNVRFLPLSLKPIVIIALTHLLGPLI